MTELKPFRGGYYLWKYLPSITRAAIFVALFLIVTVAHCWRMYRTKKWFCIPLIAGGYMEFIGYIVRITARTKTDRLMPYAIQSSFILLAPILFAATIYMTLGRVILSVRDGATSSLISPSKLTKIFVTGDILTLCVQSGASGLIFMQSTRSTGDGIVIAGLILQLCLFGAFLVTAVRFQAKVEWSAGARTGDMAGSKRSLYMLYVVSALIMVRCVFRLVEYIGGQDGYLLSTEWPLYVFDTTPMWLVLAVFYLRFPDGLQPFVGNEVVRGDCSLLESVHGTKTDLHSKPASWRSAPHGNFQR